MLRQLWDFLAWDRQSINRTDEEIVREYDRLHQSISNPVILNLVDHRLNLRTIVSALRRRRRGQEPPLGVGPLVEPIRRNWQHPQFNLQRRFPWIEDFAVLPGAGRIRRGRACACTRRPGEHGAVCRANLPSPSKPSFCISPAGPSSIAGRLAAWNSDRNALTNSWRRLSVTPWRSSAEARVLGVTGNIVAIESDGPIMKNGVAYVHVGEQRLKSEVLRVFGNQAEMQVFEDTQGVRVGDRVELTPDMLSAVLGPGLLGTVFDGLQNPLHKLAERDGYFLQRGSSLPALSHDIEWPVQPLRTSGEFVRAGDILAVVPERRIQHKIMVPFANPASWNCCRLTAATVRVHQPIARVRDGRGHVREWSLQQTWPVRRPLPASLLEATTLRAAISDPALDQHHSADRHLFSDRPRWHSLHSRPVWCRQDGAARLDRPLFGGRHRRRRGLRRAGGRSPGYHHRVLANGRSPRAVASLMDRTIIICNTSSMPVAAREASIYTGITLGEYYRQMGLDVLLLADSTSRWAQAMRETSGRLEEIPGEEAFPAYLDSAIKSVYERAGVLRTNDGSEGQSDDDRHGLSGRRQL